MAQDPIKVDPNHYKVEFENDQVRDKEGCNIFYNPNNPGMSSIMSPIVPYLSCITHRILW